MRHLSYLTLITMVLLLGNRTAVAQTTLSAEEMAFEGMQLNEHKKSDIATNDIKVSPTLPEAPTHIIAQAGLNKVTVSFNAPANSNDLNTTCYTVTAQPYNVTSIGFSGSPITISGLDYGIEYSFTVKATNSNGTSIESQPSNLVSPYSETSTFFGTGNWSDAINWTNGIPGIETAVVIEGNMTLNTCVSVKTMTIDAGANLAVGATQILSTDNGIYNNGTITNNGTILGAVVVPIKFEEYSGTPVADLTQNRGTSLTLPASIKSGYALEGWYTEPEFTNLFTNTTVPLNGLTLYAQWREVETATVQNGDTFEVYPNPSEGTIYVKVGNNITLVKLFDMNGSLLLSRDVTESTAIDIRSLKNGTYNLIANGKMVKVIKQ